MRKWDKVYAECMRSLYHAVGEWLGTALTYPPVDADYNTKETIRAQIVAAQWLRWHWLKWR